MMPAAVEIRAPGEAPQITRLSGEQWRFLEAICQAGADTLSVALERRVADELVAAGVPLQRAASGRWRLADGAEIQRVCDIGI